MMRLDTNKDDPMQHINDALNKAIGEVVKAQKNSDLEDAVNRSGDTEVINIFNLAKNNEPEPVENTTELSPEEEAELEPENPYTLQVFRESLRALNEQKIKGQIQYILERIDSGNRKGKWTATYKLGVPSHNGLTRSYTYTVTISLTPTFYVEGKTEREFDVIQDIAETAAGTQKWQLARAGKEVYYENKDKAKISIPDDWYNAYFGHIYEREAQIDIIMSAVQAGIESEFENRFHCVLHGPAACGKTEITRTFKDMLGEEAVLEYDATSTTQAGAIKDLNARAVMPQMLIVEEIEKTDENSLRWLLSVLDHRAEIRKTNFNVDIQKEVKLICIATVNDMELFSKLMYGALASRFPNKIYCPRPSRSILERILLREIKKVDGAKIEWIAPAIDYAERYGINDPRNVTAICLCGRNDLLDGSYQKKLQACRAPIDELEIAP